LRHERYIYIKRNVEKVWGACNTLGARYLSKNKVNSDFTKHSSVFVFTVRYPKGLGFIGSANKGNMTVGNCLPVEAE
jgi:hypothetical protein